MDLGDSSLSLRIGYEKIMSEFSILSLGSNLSSHVGNSKQTVLKAIEAMAEQGVEVQKLSSIYRTPPFPAGSGADYANAVAIVQSPQSPDDLLATLLEIEQNFGRERNARWDSRSLDIDLIAQGERILPDKGHYEIWRNMPIERQKSEWPNRLILPHPRVHQRAFVLVPLAEIMPEWRHPYSGETVLEMLAKIPQSQIDEVVPF